MNENRNSQVHPTTVTNSLGARDNQETIQSSDRSSERRNRNILSTERKKIKLQIKCEKFYK